MSRLHFERGRIIETSPEVVCCLWANWDIFDAVLDKKWNILKEGEGIFRVISSDASNPYWRKLKVEAKLELIESRKKVDSGFFKYLTTVMKMGFSSQIIATFRYFLTTTGATSVVGMFDMERKGFFGRLIKLFWEKRVHRIADMIIEDGDKSCTLISKNFEEAKKKLSDKQLRILKEYTSGTVLKRKEVLVEKTRISEGILQIIPLEDNSLVRLETQIPKPCKVREKVRIEAEASRIIENTKEIVYFANSLASISRGDEDGISPNQEDEFYSKAFEVGRALYSIYIKGNIHAHLTSMLDYSDSIRLKIEAEERDAMLPWELLHNGEDFLALAIPLARTTGEAIRLASKGFDISGVLIVTSNPDNELKGVEREGDIILQALKGLENIEVKLLSKDEATKDNIIEELETGKYQVLHYSGHSIYNEHLPRLSHLLLKEGRKLIADELARLSIHRGLQLVFLNSCSSGTSSGLTTDITGIVDSFIKVGVPYVIGMKWSVSDDGALILAKEFYHSLLRLKDPIEALRGARIKVGEAFDWRDPAWAAPVIYVQ